MGYKRKRILFSVILFPMSVLAALLSMGLFFMVCSLWIFLWAEDKFSRRERLLLLIFDILLMVEIFVGNVQFEFLSQAKSLLNINANLFYWFSRGHMHAVRLLVAYPGYLLSLFGNVGINEGFTIYVGLIFELLFIGVCRVLKLYIREIWTSGFLLGILLLVLSVAMSGRIVFAFLGLFIILYQDICLIRKKQVSLIFRWFWLGVGFLLTTVSSGTMLLTFGYIFLMFIIRYLFDCSVKDRVRIAAGGGIACVIMFPVWSKVAGYIIKMLNKNISYFGGGIEGMVNMLKHGMGRIIYIADSRFYFIYFILLAGILVINVLLFVELIIRRQWEKLPLCLAVNLGLYGFCVGISTGTMMILPLALIILIRGNERRGEGNVIFNCGGTPG